MIDPEIEVKPLINTSEEEGHVEVTRVLYIRLLKKIRRKEKKR
jgi:hypothetical protein